MGWACDKYGKKSIAKKDLVVTPEGKGPRGRPGIRWKNTKIVLKTKTRELGIDSGRSEWEQTTGFLQ